MKVLFVRVQSTDEWYEDPDCQVIVLGLNESAGGIQKIIDEARKVAKRLRGSNSTVSVMDYPTVVSSVTIENVVKNFKKCEKIVDMIDSIDGDDHLILDLPVAQVLALDEEGESIEGAQIHADTLNVWWDFYPKHTTAPCESFRVPVETFAPYSGKT